VILTEATREKEGWGSAHARLLAVSPLAFTYVAKWPEGSKPPQVGDVVHTGKYPGEEVIGRDGKTYRLCSDREIGDHRTGRGPSRGGHVQCRLKPQPQPLKTRSTRR
jgi:hypothetical protein